MAQSTEVDTGFTLRLPSAALSAGGNHAQLFLDRFISLHFHGLHEIRVGTSVSSTWDQAAALQSGLVGGPFQGICSSTTAFGSNAMANCDSTVLPHNETAVAVDPNNPAHLLAGSKRYRVG